MRVPDEADSGDAKVILSFAEWKGANVASATVEVPIVAPSRVPDSEQIRTTLWGHPDIVLSVSFSPDGKTLATGCSDGTVKLWDVATWHQRRTLQRSLRPPGWWHQGGVRSLDFSADGTTLASSWWDCKTLPDSNVVEQFFGETKLWNVATGEELATLKGTRPNGVMLVTWAPHGNTLAVEELWMNEPGGSATCQVCLWDTQTRQIRAVLKERANRLTYSPDGKILATAYKDIKLWDVRNGQQLNTLEGEDAYLMSLSFGRDSQTLAALDRRGRLKLWNVRTATAQSRPLEKIPDPISSISSLSTAFSPNGKILAVGTGSWKLGEPGEIWLWNLDTQKLRTILRGHTHPVSCVAFSPDGKTLASASFDKTVKLWDVSQLEGR